jgi:hypothetical protein
MPFPSAIEVITMMAPPSFRSGSAFFTVKARPLVLIEKTLSKLSSVVSASGWGSTIPAPAKRMSNLSFSSPTLA